jgi:hypothetical protein
MRNGLAGLGANTPATPYRVKLGSGVRFDDEDMKGTLTAANGNTYTDALAGLFAAASGRYVDLDLSAIDDELTEIPAGDASGRWFAGTGSVDHLVAITLPSWATAIGSDAFSGLTKLEFVNAAETALVEIGQYAFQETGIRAITFPQTLTTFGHTVLGGSEQLRAVDMGDSGLTEIPSGCFEGCSSLREIVWPPALETIGANAFKGAGFVTLTIPSTVKTIAGAAFYRNANLVWFKWAEAPSEASIGMSFISVCGSLVRIQFPPTMGPPSRLDFQSCGSLETVILPYTPIGASVVGLQNFKDSLKDALKVKVYVPDGYVETYYGASWLAFFQEYNRAEVIVPLSELTDVPENW